MTITRYRKLPIEVDTIQWTGSNEAEVQTFTGGASHFYALDAEDREGSDDPEATAAVFDELHSTWVLVYTGQHIVRGVKGEFYPIAEDVLAETYERVQTGRASAEARVLALYEQWVKAGPPPLGVSTSRWWDTRLTELHAATTAAEQAASVDWEEIVRRRERELKTVGEKRHAAEQERDQFREALHKLRYGMERAKGHEFAAEYVVNLIDTTLEQVAVRALEPCDANAQAARAEQAEAERDGAYRERAHLIALIAALTDGAVITPAVDIDEPGWQIVYLTIGTRQCSWHISPRDAELFAFVERVESTDPRAQWDGHTTEEKYAGIAAWTAEVAQRCGPACAEQHTECARCEIARNR